MGKGPEFIDELEIKYAKDFDDFFSGVPIEEEGIERDWFNLFRGMYIDTKLEDFIKERVLSKNQFNDYLADIEVKYNSSSFTKQVIPENLFEYLLGDSNNMGIIQATNVDEGKSSIERGLANSALMAVDGIVNIDWGPRDVSTSELRDIEVSQYMMQIGTLIALRYENMMSSVLNPNQKRRPAGNFSEFLNNLNERPLDLTVLSDFFEKFETDRRYFENIT